MFKDDEVKELEDIKLTVFEGKIFRIIGLAGSMAESTLEAAECLHYDLPISFRTDKITGSLQFHIDFF